MRIIIRERMMIWKRIILKKLTKKTIILLLTIQIRKLNPKDDLKVPKELGHITKKKQFRNRVINNIGVVIVAELVIISEIVRKVCKCINGFIVSVSSRWQF